MHEKKNASPNRKLRLKRETVKALSPSQLGQVAGGGGRYHTDACHSAIQTDCCHP